MNEMFALAGPVRGRIVASVLVDMLLTICLVAQGSFIALWLNSLYATGGDAVWLAAFAGAAVLRSLAAWAVEVQAQATAHALKAHLRQRLLTQLVALGPGYALDRQTGDLQTIIVNGVESLETYFSRYVPAIVSALIGCAAVLVVIGLIDWPTAGILLLFLVTQPLLDRLWMRWRMPKLSGVFGAAAAFGAYFLDNLQGLSTLKTFDAAGRRRAELVRRARALRQQAMPKISLTMARIAITSFVTLGGVATVLAMNSWRVVSGSLAPIALLLTLFLAREVFRPLERVEKEFHAAQAAKGAVQPILKLLAAKPIVIEPAQAAPLPKTTTIAFEAVTFGYPTGERPALTEVSFAVPQGAMVAVVGPSGAGKSTLFSLMLRFFAPQSGAIRLGGVDIADLSSADLRSRITMVAQDVQLFHGTIAQNLRIAKPDASDAELRAATRAAHIDAFIDSLPQGYASEVGERGSHLSGGQRQRIAIARALLKDAPIVLLDEATSSVDPANERAIQASLEALAENRTMLVIAHRLATVERADLIIVMDDGRIVEQGRHDELLLTRGPYHRLVTAGDLAA